MRRTAMQRSVTVTLSVLGILGVLAIVTFADRANTRPSPVVEGEYVGATSCRRCHFQDFRHWSGSEHAKAFEQLPAQYRDDAQCLTCHATGHGQPGGFVSMEETRALAGVSCEACHGPGSEHVAFWREHDDQKDDPAIQAEGRSLLDADHARSACYTCHLSQTHGSHPEFDR